MNCISLINKYEKEIYYMDLYLKFNMGTIIRHQFLKLTMHHINWFLEKLLGDGTHNFTFSLQLRNIQQI